MRYFKRLTVPERAHPMVRDLYRLMNEEQVGLLDMSERVGTHKDTITGWRTKSTPRVDMLEACLNVLGYRLRIERIPEAAE